MVFPTHGTAEKTNTQHSCFQKALWEDVEKSDLLHEDTNKPNTLKVLKFKESTRGSIYF